MRRAETRRIGAVVALAAGVAWSCGLATVGTGPVEPATDASSRDTSFADAAMPPDSTTADAADLRDAFPADAADVTDAFPADAADVTDAAMPDTNVTDTATEDAGRPDAAPDALDSATFCATVMPPPTFCADFDEPDASPGGGWNYTVSEAGASVTLSETTFTSAPRSLHATSAQGGAGSVSLAFSMVNKISVDFDVFYTALPDSGDVSSVLLTGPMFPGQDIYYFAHTTGSYFQEFGNDYSPGLSAPSLNAWHHVSIAVATTGAKSTISASIDGTSGWTNHTLMQAWPASTTAILQIGLASLYQVANYEEVFVDNVVVRANQ